MIFFIFLLSVHRAVISLPPPLTEGFFPPYSFGVPSGSKLLTFISAGVCVINVRDSNELVVIHIIYDVRMFHKFFFLTSNDINFSITEYWSLKLQFSFRTDANVTYKLDTATTLPKAFLVDK